MLSLDAACVPELVALTATGLSCCILAKGMTDLSQSAQ